ncbi:aminotransferase class I/II-fold pyridoxal phosphate-dependent enzyme [Methylocystis sp. ATCC 49242]|uniref:aminotransferase class I/II-fold pyridoxal phosphate-dependent enzyme n=1 Tax=Methylocystis sp. ATCC 49242 TaxID=622637 RepID=UPI0001F87DE3|nr:aminotransferase class I/II-fold pyridoxal phosphate-dependent enzyme [Methylocystis sp. ATCC 49242]
MTSPLRPSRRSAVAPFMAMDVLREARALERAGRRIIHMELGEPGAPAPRLVREAAAAALRDGALGYGEALGEIGLRERIAAHYGERYGVDVTPDRVIVTTGSSGGFLLALLAAFDAGARIAVTAPGYPAYANILSSLGLEAVPLDVGPQTRFAPTADMLAAAHREKRLDGALFMSPANPTGAMIGAQELERISRYCDEAGIVFVSDEIYHGLEYAAPAQTALRFTNRAIVVNSFSKYYAMTGWRLGWLIAPPELMRPLERLQQSLAICAPTLSQRAALAAFDATGELEENRAAYAKNRALLMERLPAMGLDRFAPPDGAFYIYADVSRFTRESMDFCRRMLAEAGVAATPGPDFDPGRGATTLRLSYAGAPSQVAEGVARLEDWLRDQAPRG